MKRIGVKGTLALELKCLLIAASLGIGFARTAHAAEAEPELACDVLVYGATPGGIAAAVSAGRLGCSVILAEIEDHVGGIVSNGLTNADIGKRQAVGGLFYDFTRGVVKYYEEFDRNTPGVPNLRACRSGYCYEAHVAEQLFHEMLAGEKERVRLRLRHQLKRATVEQGRLVAVDLVDEAGQGRVVHCRARVFIDATYEGDLAAMAGAAYRVGRESRNEFNEPHAGRVYLKFGTTELLPGSTGAADNATEGYCFRFHVTDIEANRIPIEKPANYRREDYHFVLEDIRAGRATKFRHVIQLIAMPGGKFELNSDHPHPDTGVPSESLDLAEENWEWPTATPERRREIYQRYLTHNVGLVWLLQNDPEVPADMREDARRWGWCRDEWADNGHVPRQVYVRQGRRIEGDYLLTEHDGDIVALERTRLQPTSIAVIEWPYDPHGCHKFDPQHPGVREGYFFVKHAPFQVPYGVLTPRDIDGLLVPVACSCSHVAYNALRMEPVFMALGQASGIAAHLAVRDGLAVRDVPPGELQRLLVERRGVITFYSDLPFDHPHFAALQWLGARGLNPRYEATPELKMTRRHGWIKLQRILAAEGKTWDTFHDEPDAKLTGKDVCRWLREAGYEVPNDEPCTVLADKPLVLAEFAELVYHTLAPHGNRVDP